MTQNNRYEIEIKFDLFALFFFNVYMVLWSALSHNFFSLMFLTNRQKREQSDEN